MTTNIGFDCFDVVSIQSTARPGCIIELDQLADSCGSWTKADLFHVYQESLLVQRPAASGSSSFAASGGGNWSASGAAAAQQFSESYYLVLLEKKQLKQQASSDSSATPAKAPQYVETVHMWKITIASAVQFASNAAAGGDEQPAPAPPQAVKFSSSSSSPGPNTPTSLGGRHFTLPTNNNNNTTPPSSSQPPSSSKNRLSITSARVCHQVLPLPDDVHVVCADTAAANTSSSAMFTQNKVPYLFSTACSDGRVRFWSPRRVDTSALSSSSSSSSAAATHCDRMEFAEWELSARAAADEQSSQVSLESYPLAISCSYNSRFAVAFKKSAPPLPPRPASSTSLNARSSFHHLQQQQQTTTSSIRRDLVLSSNS